MSREVVVQDDEVVGVAHHDRDPNLPIARSRA